MINQVRIADLYKSKKPVSFEVFPPKKDSDAIEIYHSIEEMCGLSPDFISVTCGAGGTGNVNKTAEIAAFIQNTHGITAMAHQTCVSSRRGDLDSALNEMAEAGIHNVLALRGDIPKGMSESNQFGDYKYAFEMIMETKSKGFCTAAACYPEGHIECDSQQDSIEHLKKKQECGADFFISQLFFSNDIFFSFLEMARKNGIIIPISPGVMPILSQKQIERMIFMCGSSLPSDIIRLLHKYERSPGDLRKAGIDHAARQLADLLSRGADGVHIYAMNKPEIARTCMGMI